MTAKNAIQELTAHVGRAPRGPKIGAIFDLDRTLLEGFSAYAFLGERLMSGAMPPKEMLANVAAFANYSLGRVGFSGVVGTTTRALRGVAEATMEELGERVFRKSLIDRIYPEARALLKAHQARGHTIAIVSSATRYQIEPVARHLGIPNVLCTRLEIENGLFTGNVIRPTCSGKGKVVAAEKLAGTHGVDLARSFFYTDAKEDLPLLEAVGHPFALNPDRELARIATERDWPVMRFAKRAPGVAEAVGTGAGYAAMIPAALAGQAVRLVTGSARAGANVTTATWADFTAFAIGLDLRVKGREHLWSHRPAIFVFNHQSQADAVIMAKLLRQDFTGVAKKELEKHPLGGPMFRSVGAVFIDRSNRDKALEALKPVIDTLKSGVSLVIAPEGTRSETEKLGPFKKGAFHMAIQAKVPIVPVVIHNAIDVQRKGQVLFRPATVRIEVLPPVPTKTWRTQSIDAHVAEVRGMFLRALGQAPATGRRRPAAPKAKSKASR